MLNISKVKFREIFYKIVKKFKKFKKGFKSSQKNQPKPPNINKLINKIYFLYSLIISGLLNCPILF